MKTITTTLLAAFAFVATPALANTPINFSGTDFAADREALISQDKDIAFAINKGVLAKEDINIAEVDLDNDGKNEVLVYITGAYGCGSHGCSFDVMTKGENGTLKSIMDGSNIVNPDIELSDMSLFGHKVILTDGRQNSWFFSPAKKAYARTAGLHFFKLD